VRVAARAVGRLIESSDVVDSLRVAGGLEEKSLTPMRGSEIISTDYRFTPSFFFLILALVWTALTVYLSTIYFWNIVIGSAVTASLYGLAWRFRSAGHRAKIS